MLDARMSLIPSHVHSNSNFDTGDGTADGKEGVILNPTPSNDPDDPLVSSPSLDCDIERYHELNKNLELVHPEKNSQLRTHLLICSIYLCSA